MISSVLDEQKIRIEYWNLGDKFLCHAQFGEQKVNSVGETLKDAILKLLEQIEI